MNSTKFSLFLLVFLKDFVMNNYPSLFAFASSAGHKYVSKILGRMCGSNRRLLKLNHKRKFVYVESISKKDIKMY